LEKNTVIKLQLLALSFDGLAATVDVVAPSLAAG